MKRKSLFITCLFCLISVNVFACGIWKESGDGREYWSGTIIEKETVEAVEKIAGVQFAYSNKYRLYVDKAESFDWNEIHPKICEILKSTISLLEVEGANLSVFQNADVIIKGDAKECTFQNCMIYIGKDAKKIDMYPSPLYP